MPFTQFAIKYKDIHGKEMMIDTFWVNDQNEIDMGELPGKTEIATLLKMLITKEVYAEETGSVVDDND